MDLICFVIVFSLCNSVWSSFIGIHKTEVFRKSWSPHIDYRTMYIDVPVSLNNGCTCHMHGTTLKTQGLGPSPVPLNLLAIIKPPVNNY